MNVRYIYFTNGAWHEAIRPDDAGIIGGAGPVVLDVNCFDIVLEKMCDDWENIYYRLLQAIRPNDALIIHDLEAKLDDIHAKHTSLVDAYNKQGSSMLEIYNKDYPRLLKTATEDAIYWEKKFNDGHCD